MRLGGELGYRILKATAKRVASENEHEKNPSIPLGRALLEEHFSAEIWDRIRGKQIVDYGSGGGLAAAALALSGARAVYGIEIQERLLEVSRKLAAEHGVSGLCSFVPEPACLATASVDLVLSTNSFEHYSRPGEVLREMHRMLRQKGELLVSFSPPWKHPYGSHMHFINMIPWLPWWFTEEAIMRLRADYVQDGATRFEEIEGGLNKMTIEKFLRVVQEEGFRTEWLDLVPIKGLRWLVRNGVTREYFTSRIRARLSKS